MFMGAIAHMRCERGRLAPKDQDHRQDDGGAADQQRKCSGRPRVTSIRMKTGSLAAGDHRANQIFTSEKRHQDNGADMEGDERQQAIGKPRR